MTMSLLEAIIHELSSAPESLLLEVFDLIQSEKDQTSSASNKIDLPRIPGLHQGEIWMSEDFNDPLLDKFWLDEDR